MVLLRMIQQSSAIWNDKYLSEFTVVFANILECESVACSVTTLTGASRFHTSTPLGIWTQVPCDGKQTGSPLDQWDMVWIKWDCRLSTGLPPGSRLVGCEAGRGDLQRAWNWERRAVWDQVGLSHCRHEGLWWFGTKPASDETTDMINHVGVTNVARQR
jgi:hypothetical protein